MARLPLLTPRTITYDQSLPAKNLPFPPCGRRVSPIQAASCHLQSGHGECLPATQLYLSVFTCLTVSLDLPSDAGESLPARQPYLFHPTAGETYPSRPRVFSSCRMSARASRPHILRCYVFTCPTQRVLISGWTSARCSRPDNLTFFCLYLSNAASLDLRLDAGEVLPARQSYYSVFTCPTQRVLISGWTPARCSRPDNLTFSVFTCPTQQVLVSRWTPARCSRPDNLTFPVFTCPTKQVLVSRWTPARCSRPDKRSSVCSHQKYRTPSNATYPAVLASLAFSPPPARFHHPAHKYQSHLRCRRASRLDNLTFSSFVSEANPSNRRARPPVGCRLSIPTKLYLSVFTCPTQ